MGLALSRSLSALSSRVGATVLMYLNKYEGTMPVTAGPCPCHLGVCVTRARNEEMSPEPQNQREKERSKTPTQHVERRGVAWHGLGRYVPGHWCFT